MKNFEEFEELVKISKRINEIEESQKKLELDLNNKCSYFVEKHNKVNVKSFGSNLGSMLKNGVMLIRYLEEKFSKLESVEQDISINDLFIHNNPS
jgi:DUF4097 and DUF4098 domain-containing protein YvlB